MSRSFRSGRWKHFVVDRLGTGRPRKRREDKAPRWITGNRDIWKMKVVAKGYKAKQLP